MDWSKVKADELAIAKKLALMLIEEELAEVLPLAVAEANTLLPAALVPEAVLLEQQYVPKLQATVLQLLKDKISPPAVEAPVAPAVPAPADPQPVAPATP